MLMTAVFSMHVHEEGFDMGELIAGPYRMWTEFVTYFPMIGLVVTAVFFICAFERMFRGPKS